MQYEGVPATRRISLFSSSAKTTKARKLKFAVAEFTSFAHISEPKTCYGQVRSLPYNVILKGLRSAHADLGRFERDWPWAPMYSTMLARKWVRERVAKSRDLSKGHVTLDQ